MKIKDRISADWVFGFCIVAISVIAFIGFEGIQKRQSKQTVTTPAKMTAGTDGYVMAENTNWYTTNFYKPGKPDKWGMSGSQDRYIDWPYPPLRTNLSRYTIIPNHGILWTYFCNDGQIRWEFKPQQP